MGSWSSVCVWGSVWGVSAGGMGGGRVDDDDVARHVRHQRASIIISLCFWAKILTTLSFPFFFSLSPLLSHPQALFDLEATNNELKSDLRDLYINSAQEVDVTNGRTAIAIHVSAPLKALKHPPAPSPLPPWLCPSACCVSFRVPAALCTWMRRVTGGSVCVVPSERRGWGSGVVVSATGSRGCDDLEGV